MKKKILFVLPSLDAGGAEKSLVNLLNCIDFNQYDVDLVLFKNTGIFLKQLPSKVTIIDLGGDYEVFTKCILYSMLDFLKQRKWSLALNRITFTIKNKFIGPTSEQHSWKNIRRSIPTLTHEYDAAIGFLEKSSIYFTVDCVSAKKKIGFIHTDYDEQKLNKNFDANYFKKLDAVATVSEKCVSILQKNFPEQKEKMKLIYNIVSDSLIRKMAEEKISDLDETKPIFVSIGRLIMQKGFESAIEAAVILKNKNIDFTWYIIGEGALRVKLEELVKLHNLQNHFVLLGLRENPYPYIKKATIFLQPSKYEGKSIAIDEAKILNKPIIVTNFSTAKDQIDDNVNGLIVDMNSESIADGIIKLLNSQSLQDKFKLNLSNEQLGSEDEIFKFYKLLDE